MFNTTWASLTRIRTRPKHWAGFWIASSLKQSGSLHSNTLSQLQIKGWSYFLMLLERTFVTLGKIQYSSMTNQLLFPHLQIFYTPLDEVVQSSHGL
jgi:hypothetical protein